MGTTDEERGIQMGLLKAWLECKDTLLMCSTRAESHAVGGCMNRILALMGRDPERDPNRVVYPVEGLARVD